MLCSVEGCSRERFAKEPRAYSGSLCSLHRKRYKETGRVGPAETLRPPRPKFCQVDGCDRACLSKDMCGMHYQRVLTTGLVGPTEALRANNRSRSLEEAFWSNVRKGKPNACWLWRGSRLPSGYGFFRHRGVFYYAHRVSLRLSGRWVGRVVLHACDTPTCVNPRHLRSGTHRDNALDMMRKGRGVTKLSPELVLEIRADQRTQAEIAESFELSVTTVGRVKRRESWAWVA